MVTAPDNVTTQNIYIWQKVGSVVEATYTLNYLAGARAIDATYIPGTVANDAGFFNISLWAGGTAPFAADGATLLGTDGIDIPETSPVSNNTLAQSSTFIVSTNIGQDLWLRLDSKYATAGVQGGGGLSNQVQIDNITGSYEEVPEPASLALLALGGLMMAPRRRARVS